MNFILDTNVFVQAKRTYYAFDIAQPFWDCLLANALANELGSIDKVYREIERGQDQLYEWSRDHFRPYFNSSDSSDVIVSFAELVQWVGNQGRYYDGAKANFASVDYADGLLIAHARVLDATVVTLETPDANNRNRVKIPDVCQHFGVRTCNTFDMLRQIGFRF